MNISGIVYSTQEWSTISPTMPTTLLSRFFEKFTEGLLATVFEKWVDGAGLIGPILVQLLRRRWSNVWELLGPSLIILILIMAVHVILSIKEVWKDITRRASVHEVDGDLYTADNQKQRRLIADSPPPLFRVKLAGIAISALVMLCALSVSVASKIPLGSETECPESLSYSLVDVTGQIKAPNDYAYELTVTSDREIFRIRIHLTTVVNYWGAEPGRVLIQQERDINHPALTISNISNRRIHLFMSASEKVRIKCVNLEN